MLISGNFVIGGTLFIFFDFLVTGGEGLAYSRVSGSVIKLTSVGTFEHQML